MAHNVFIVGSGRNGSTMLATHLNRSPNVFIPREQYFLNELCRFPFIPTSMKIVDMCIDRTERWSRHLRKSAYSNIRAASAFRIISPREFYEAMVYSYAYMVDRQGDYLKVIGDQTPLMSQHYKTVYSKFPDAKYIFLFRDPVEVVASYKKIHPNLSVEKWTQRWITSAECYSWLAVNGYDVRAYEYRDLVIHFPTCVKAICDWLEVEYCGGTPDIHTLAISGALGVSKHKNVATVPRLIHRDPTETISLTDISYIRNKTADIIEKLELTYA